MSYLDMAREIIDSRTTTHSTVVEGQYAVNAIDVLNPKVELCHTCTCALKEGKVEYEPEPLEPPEPGQVLICCAKPTTDVVIDL